MKKVAKRLTEIAKMKTNKKASTKKTAGEMELAQRVVEQQKRIVALEKAVAELQKLIVK